ncbi:MAG: hypothetical protein Q4E75_00030 [bacterium]|nr:hypothetical protein [bacterium]
MMLKEGKKEKIIGVSILIFVIVFIVIIKTFVVDKNKNLTHIYGAVGGGKEDFLADEDFNKILAKKYGVKFVSDTWSNGKTVKEDVRRENGDMYDLIFFSDQRFYDYYKTSPKFDEAQRYTVLDGGLTLNTPIVIYSWDIVVDALIKENIVTLKDGVYYITDMNKMIDYILQGKKWSDIGLDIYGYININSTDPVTSSPGATYYGLLLSIMSGGDINENNINNVLPKLKQFYQKSGYMNNTPADLFELYLKTGVGSKPMIVDYEKSIIEFKNSNPKGYEEIKDSIRMLYPTPTIWNSHCIATLSEKGNKYLKAFEDKDIQQIAWEKYGFRVGISGGVYDVSKIGINGIPQSITSTTAGLKMDIYNNLIDYLSN